MKLKLLISALERCTTTKPVRFRRAEGEQADPEYDDRVPDGASPGELCSYRGYYERLCIQTEQVGRGPNPPCTVLELLKRLRNAMNKSFTGYKGGSYSMGENSLVHAAPYGDTNSDKIVGVQERENEVALILAFVEEW